MSRITFLKQNPSKLGWDSPIRKMACGLSFLLWLALLQTSLAVNVPGPNGTVVTQILSATSSNPEVKVVEDRDLGKILVYPPQPKEFTVKIIARIMYPDDQYLEKISTVMVGGAGVTIESSEIRNSLILATLKVAPGASGGRFSITYENEDNPNHKGCNVRLLPVEFKDYFGGSVFDERVVPKCCAEKVKKNMLTHLYPDGGSEQSVYLHSGDTLNVSVRVPDVSGMRYELIYEVFGKEVERKEVKGSKDIQIVKYDPTTLDFVKRALAQFGFEMSVQLLMMDNGGKEILKSPKLKFLVDDAHLRNSLFKIKIEPFGQGTKTKGSFSELLMGMMLHEVSRGIVKLVEKNTISHTLEPEFHLQDPRATQGTNRLIMSKINSQIGKAGSEWDKAADYALNVEKVAFEKARNQILIGNFLGAKKTIVDAIFHDAFNELEKIENKIRGEGWGMYGCPCGGDNEVLKATSLRGVNSQEVLNAVAQYSPAAALGIAVVPRSFIEDQMKVIQQSKLDDLKNNFEESWRIGGCCD